MGPPSLRHSSRAKRADRNRRGWQTEIQGSRFGGSAKRRVDVRQIVERGEIGEIQADRVSAPAHQRVGNGGMEALTMQFTQRFALFAMIAALVPIASAQAKFQAHDVATGLRGGYQVVVADLNHDGKPDLIALASGLTELAWYENPGWQRHVLANGLSHMINCTTIDVPGDPIPQIVLASEFANEAKNSIGVVSVLRHQGDPRDPWSVTEIDRLTTSHRLRTADIDGSGKRVVLNAPLTGASAAAPDYS